MFYERSKSLVGICKDVGTNSSRTMTLDLTKYEKQPEADKKKAKRTQKRRAVSEVVAEPSKKRRAIEPASPGAGSIATQ
jgi:hypothetical protein